MKTQININLAVKDCATLTATLAYLAENHPDVLVTAAPVIMNGGGRVNENQRTPSMLHGGEQEKAYAEWCAENRYEPVRVPRKLIMTWPFGNPERDSFFAGLLERKEYHGNRNNGGTTTVAPVIDAAKIAALAKNSEF